MAATQWPHGGSSRSAPEAYSVGTIVQYGQTDGTPLVAAVEKVEWVVEVGRRAQFWPVYRLRRCDTSLGAIPSGDIPHDRLQLPMDQDPAERNPGANRAQPPHRLRRPRAVRSLTGRARACRRAGGLDGGPRRGHGRAAEDVAW